ncbi:hypothetical protein [Pelagerythrobacter rhizovicinus]|uniref:Uncharacterized protein n=1 Tax=Pelagerythrobacter rhizovicinus TaxID=2268576 RepID=A0A4Q2KN87_9SPHN|nr:hypothetical protein [Pelagerythrobacter rhizovicinus]RXZ64913.1 hypothetical protein ETX26_13795 [Pelagerythrobacter rhizovicinus]
MLSRAMYFDPFRNKWAALALAGLILLAAAALVGSEDSGGLLDRMADRQRAGDSEPPGPSEMPERVPPPALAPPEGEFSEPIDGGSFTPDSELIDAAEGFDAGPMIISEAPDENPVLEAEEEVSMLPYDVEGSGS